MNEMNNTAKFTCKPEDILQMAFDEYAKPTKYPCNRPSHSKDVILTYSTENTRFAKMMDERYGLSVQYYSDGGYNWNEDYVVGVINCDTLFERVGGYNTGEPLSNFLAVLADFGIVCEIDIPVSYEYMKPVTYYGEVR